MPLPAIFSSAAAGVRMPTAPWMTSPLILPADQILDLSKPRKKNPSADEGKASHHFLTSGIRGGRSLEAMRKILKSVSRLRKNFPPLTEPDVLGQEASADFTLPLNVLDAISASEPGDDRRRKYPWATGKEERLVIPRLRKKRIPPAAEMFLPAAELERLRGEAMKMRKWVRGKKAGVTPEVVKGIRRAWRKKELAMVKIVDPVRQNMVRAHEIVEGNQESSGSRVYTESMPCVRTVCSNSGARRGGTGASPSSSFVAEILIKIATGERPTTTLPSSIKLEIVVLDGDFPYDDSENWSNSEFNRYVVKEREGRKPLLTGITVVKLKDGAAAIDELKFTDNSSWTRSGNFRIGVRLSSEYQQSLNIREAVSSPFKVKDHRGEAYKKHYPPLLSDEVWRLENIGKDGVFHNRLVEKNINTVQDFLKLSIIDSAQLRKTMRMSKGNWEATINHARTCPLGDKLYIHHGPHFSTILNPICEIMNILVDGAFKTFQELNISMRVELQQSVLEAYNCWDELEEISIPSQVETQQNEVFIDVELMPNNELMGVEIWSQEMQNSFL